MSESTFTFHQQSTKPREVTFTQTCTEQTGEVHVGDKRNIFGGLPEGTEMDFDSDFRLIMWKKQLIFQNKVKDIVHVESFAVMGVSRAAVTQIGFPIDVAFGFDEDAADVYMARMQGTCSTFSLEHILYQKCGFAFLCASKRRITNATPGCQRGAHGKIENWKN